MHTITRARRRLRSICCDGRSAASRANGALTHTYLPTINVQTTELTRHSTNKMGQEIRFKATPTHSLSFHNFIMCWDTRNSLFTTARTHTEYVHTINRLIETGALLWHVSIRFCCWFYFHAPCWPCTFSPSCILIRLRMQDSLDGLPLHTYCCWLRHRLYSFSIAISSDFVFYVLLRRNIFSPCTRSRSYCPQLACK